MAQDLITYLDERFREMHEGNSRNFERINKRLDRIESRLDGVEGRLDGVEGRLEGVEEGVRHTQVMVEGLRDNDRQLAEGIIGFGEQIENLRGEFKLQFEDVKGLLRPTYAQLDRRITQLEVWRETKERDPMDIIRERFGKKPEQ